MQANETPPLLRYGVVVLAAGASSRMGRPKLLLPWGATSVLGHLISQWTRLEARQIAVVTAAPDGPLGQELDRLGVPNEDRLINTEPELGMFGSVVCAARWPGWQSDLTHWLITLGDQPHLNAESLAKLISFGAARAELISQPSRNGRPRHPVLLPKAAFRRLAETEATNLKAFLQTVPDWRALCEMEDSGFDLDIDSPEDYVKALSLAGFGGGKTDSQKPRSVTAS